MRYDVHMDVQTCLPISEARKQLFSIDELAQKPGRHFTLTKQGRPRLVVLSSDEYNSLIETMEVLSDPRALKRIQAAEAAYEKGDYVTLDELKGELGYSVSRKRAVRRHAKK